MLAPRGKPHEAAGGCRQRLLLLQCCLPLFLSMMLEWPALVCFWSGACLDEFKNLFVSSISQLGFTHNSWTLIMGVIVGQERLCQGACLILWGLAWLADVNCMEVIKCEGNVMWAEFKCSDFVAFFFFFFLILRRMEREKTKVQRVKEADREIRLLVSSVWNVKSRPSTVWMPLPFRWTLGVSMLGALEPLLNQVSFLHIRMYTAREWAFHVTKQTWREPCKWYPFLESLFHFVQRNATSVHAEGCSLDFWA